MIKASALFAVVPNTEYKYKGLSELIKNNQNIVIESVKGGEEITESVENLALRLMKYDEILKDIISALRLLYVTKREDFHLSLAGISKSEKDVIINLFQDMYGIISTFHYCQENDMLNGRIIISSKAQAFIAGQYMEIAMFRQVKDIVDALSKKYGKPYEIYRNVRVTTKEGRLKNEFDLIIEFDDTFYVVEIKSGKNFREFDKFVHIGREYQIVPHRFLLVNNCIFSEHAETIEYFCDYYVTNLTDDGLAKKITKMIENDQKGDEKDD